MNQEFLSTLLLTAKLAGLTTIILLVIGFPVAYLLAFRRFALKSVVEAFISMPMVLPPTVIGFYMLIAYSPQHSFGHFLDQYLNVRLAFSFTGVLIASVVFSLPFMIQPLQAGLQSIPTSLREASYTLGKSEFKTFIHVLVPNMIPSMVTAIAMTFAHSIGEFGVVIMVGGNIPGETKVASIAIYDAVQGMDYATANKYSFVLFMLSFVILTLIFSFNKPKIY
jgi:molybdate transport system permease protein